MLTSVIEGATAAGKRQMLAVIGDSANQASISLHLRLGFAPVGTFRAVGFKFGRWVDSVLMQRAPWPRGAGARRFLKRTGFKTIQEKRAVRLARPKFWEGERHEGRRDNVLSGEISVVALQKMMLHKRNVKHLKRLYIT